MKLRTIPSIKVILKLRTNSVADFKRIYEFTFSPTFAVKIFEK